MGAAGAALGWLCGLELLTFDLNGVHFVNFCEFQFAATSIGPASDKRGGPQIHIFIGLAALFSSEDDGTRTRNHRIDSPVL